MVSISGVLWQLVLKSVKIRSPLQDIWGIFEENVYAWQWFYPFPLLWAVWVLIKFFLFSNDHVSVHLFTIECKSFVMWNCTILNVMPISSPYFTYTTTFKKNIIHGHSLLQYVIHKWHFGTGNNMTESWLLIAQVKYSSCSSMELGIISWPAHTYKITYASHSMIYWRDIEEKLYLYVYYHLVYLPHHHSKCEQTNLMQVVQGTSPWMAIGFVAGCQIIAL